MTTLNTDFKVKHGLTVNGNTTLYGTSNAVGTISSGVWQGTPVSLQYGGTGADLSASSGYFLLNAGSLSLSTTIPATAITGTLTNPTTGNADSATKLATGRTIAMTGDLTWTSPVFDGTANVTAAGTLAASGVTAGTYTSVTVNLKGLVTGGTNPTTLAGYGITDAVSSNTAITAGTATKITYDAKGLVTAGTTLVAADIPVLDWSKITTGKPTTIAGYGITDATPSSHLTDYVLHLTASQNTWIDAITATSAEVNYLSGVTSAVQTQINNRVIKNADITAGTNTKITYDAKGLVTAGTTLVAADIPALDWSKITTGKPTTLSGYGITDATPSSHATDYALHLTAAQNTWIDAITVTAAEVNYLSGVTSAVQTQINNRVVKNADITAGTATKVTYDAKGLVTSGTNITAADVPALDWSKITTGVPTTIAGYGITDAQTKDADLTAIAGLVGTSGFLKKTAADTWALDTNTYITGNQTVTLSGDVSGSGTTAITTTLATIAGLTAGSYGSATAIPVVSVDVKGRVTAISSTAVDIPSGTLTFTGDVTGAGTTGSSTTLTLATSGATAGTYGSSTYIPVLTVDAKGRVTLASDTPAYQPYDMSNFINSVLLSNEQIFRLVVVRAFTIPANFAGSLAYATTTAQASAVFSIRKNGVQFATLTYAAGSSTGTFGATAAVTFNVGDQLTVTAPATPDNLLAGIAITFACSGSGTSSTAAAVSYVTNVTGGAANQVLYQSATDATSFIAAPTVTGTVMSWNGTNIVWSYPSLPTSNTSLPVVQGNIQSATYTSAATTANQVIDSISATTAGTVKYLIQVTSGGARQACELLVTHNGAATSSVEYGNVVTGSALASFDTDISGGNVHLLATPVNAATTFKVIRTIVFA